LFKTTKKIIFSYYLIFILIFFQSFTQSLCLDQRLLLPGRDHGTDRHVGRASQLRLRQASERGHEANVDLRRVLHHHAWLRQLQTLPQPQPSLSADPGGHGPRRGRGQRRRRPRRSQRSGKAKLQKVTN
jgi:hypothetical protein